MHELRWLDSYVGGLIICWSYLYTTFTLYTSIVKSTDYTINVCFKTLWYIVNILCSQLCIVLSAGGLYKRWISKIVALLTLHVGCPGHLTWSCETTWYRYKTFVGVFSKTKILLPTQRYTFNEMNIFTSLFWFGILTYIYMRFVECEINTTCRENKHVFTAVGFEILSRRMQKLDKRLLYVCERCFKDWQIMLLVAFH